MNPLTLKIKAIPVWLIVLILVVGTVAAAGLWMLSVDAPVRYEEPFTVEYSDELRMDEWEVITDFPYVSERGARDLTYRTFHDYFRISYEGRRPVHLNATFLVDARGDLEPYHVGFAVLEGVNSPDEITWDGNTAINGNRSADIRWGVHEENITLEANDTRDYTIINVLSNDAPLYTENDDLNIIWEFRRGEVKPRPIETRKPTPLPGVYNLTPALVAISTIISGIIGYALLKDMKGVR